MLTVRDLNVFYGPLQAVRDVTFHVGSTQIVTLLGANGAGKTSTIRAVAGLLKSTTGAITFGETTLDGQSAERRVKLGIATVPEGGAVFRTLSIEENLRMGAYLRSSRSDVERDLDWVLSVFPPLAERRRALAGALSGGQAQMLAIGRALMAAPRLLLLDEPSHGLAPNLVEELFALIPRLQRERDLSILLVEQNANKALTVASYGYVLEAGNLALEGSTSELMHDPRVAALYLGG